MAFHGLPCPSVTRLASQVRALSLGVHELIMRFDDDAEADAGGDGVPDEIDEVAAVFAAHYELVTSLFAYYAALSGGSLDCIRLNEWQSFVSDAKLVDRRRSFCGASDFDLIFVAANAADKRGQRSGRSSHSVTTEAKVCNRAEAIRSSQKQSEAISSHSVTTEAKGARALSEGTREAPSAPALVADAKNDERVCHTLSRGTSH